ncbi:MAG: Serine-tRNA ligase [Candidatus Peregrinibacteria bacterium GW2011_GWA2_47_7]|nr:MAG: Serine-tRNA ligase [Candidatus Peregrinibacteria bacterium GW2011_GWA2_47_7]
MLANKAHFYFVFFVLYTYSSMIDIRLLRENPEEVKKKLKKNHVDGTTIDAIVSLDKEKRALQQEVESLKSKQNAASKQMPKLPEDQKTKLLAEMQYVKEQLQTLTPKVEKLEEQIRNLVLLLPNIPHDSVPEGEGEEDNIVERTHGKKPSFDFPILDHATLGKKLDIIDIDSAGRSSGSRFAYLKNDAALLQFALINYVLAKVAQKGFSPVIPPVLVKEEAMYATGFFPADRNEIYHVNPEDDDLYLVGTSEVSISMLHAGEILNEQDLPKRYVGYSTCFRREAGTYGKDTHGLIRVHQFDKLELFSFCHPEKSIDEHELILGIEEEIMQELGLHYQVINMCGGELRHSPASKKYDVEVWIPSQKRFRELTSCSNCTDYQARRGLIRFADEKGEKHFVHTLNGTAVAIGRMLVALLENYQTAEGTIEIPQVLQSYMGKKVIAGH